MPPKARSEKQKMLEGRGEPYFGFDAELTSLRAVAQERQADLNTLRGGGHGTPGRIKAYAALFKKIDAEAPPHIEPNFRCDFGKNITLGQNFYANFDCVVLDCAPVEVGDNCFFGPRVSLYAVSHPLEPAERRDYTSGPEIGGRIKIGDNCWFGGNSTVLPGVTIGNGVVVGAGAVVTKDVESHVVVAGNPAKVVRYLEAHPMGPGRPGRRGLLAASSWVTKGLAGLVLALLGRAVAHDARKAKV